MDQKCCGRGEPPPSDPGDAQRLRYGTRWSAAAGALRATRAPAPARPPPAARARAARRRRAAAACSPVSCVVALRRLGRHLHSPARARHTPTRRLFLLSTRGGDGRARAAGLEHRGARPLVASRSHCPHRSPQDDALLSSLVHELGPRNWTLIAIALRERTGVERNGKSCRLRCVRALSPAAPHARGRRARARSWFNQIDPALKHGAWTEEEEATVRACAGRGATQPRSSPLTSPPADHRRAGGAGQPLGLHRQAPAGPHGQQHKEPLVRVDARLPRV